MDLLELTVPAMVGLEQVPESPLLELPDLGLRLAARALRHDGSTLSLELLVSWLLEAGEARGYQSLQQAIAVHLEDAEGGRAAALSLLDPHKKYQARRGPNFTGPRPPPPGAPGHAGGGMVLPLEVAVPLPAREGPSLYATAYLPGHLSNTLALDLSGPSVASWLGGEPRDIPSVGDDDGGPEPDEAATDEPETPPPPPPRARPPALALSARKQGGFGPGEPIWLDATLALPPEELEAFGAEGWLRALFAWATRKDTQATRASHWLGDRAVFPEDFQLRQVGGQPRAVATAAFELSGLLGGRLPPGSYLVQLSARHHRSAALELTCL